MEMIIYKTVEYLNQISKHYYYTAIGERYVFSPSGKDFDSPLRIKSFKLLFQGKFSIFIRNTFSAEVYLLFVCLFYIKLCL